MQCASNITFGVPPTPVQLEEVNVNQIKMSLFWGVPADAPSGNYTTVHEAIVDFHDNLCDLKDISQEYRREDMVDCFVLQKVDPSAAMASLKYASPDGGRTEPNLVFCFREPLINLDAVQALG